MPEYTSLVETLRWKCIQDSLFRDGMDHYQIDQARFERAAKILGPLHGLTVCDIGSFPGYGLWAFRECSRYIGMKKCLPKDKRLGKLTPRSQNRDLGHPATHPKHGFI